MGKILFDDYPIVIGKELAKAIGLNEAIVLQQVHYWIEINKKTNKNFYKDMYWTYNSLPTWHRDYFDFWSFSTVKRTFAKLINDVFLIIDNFNKDPRDQTNWYSINYKKLENIIKNPINSSSAQNEPMDNTIKFSISSNWDDGKSQSEHMQKLNTRLPLPMITSETTTNSKSFNQEYETLLNFAL